MGRDGSRWARWQGLLLASCVLLAAAGIVVGCGGSDEGGDRPGAAPGESHGGDAPGPREVSEQDLVGEYRLWSQEPDEWAQLQAWHEGSATYTLELTGDAEARGVWSCNGFWGAWTLDGSEVTLADVATTQMGCGTVIGAPFPDALRVEPDVEAGSDLAMLRILVPTFHEADDAAVGDPTDWAFRRVEVLRED